MSFEGATPTAETQERKASDHGEIKNGDDLLEYIKSVITKGEEVIGGEDMTAPSGTISFMILDEDHIARDIEKAMDTFSDVFGGNIDIDIDRLREFTTTFGNLNQFAEKFEKLQNKTEAALLVLRDEIYHEISDELDVYFRNEARKRLEVDEFYLNEGGSHVLAKKPNKWSLKVNSLHNKIENVESNGKIFTFTEVPFLDGAVDYLSYWKKQEEGIKQYNQKVTPEYQMPWESVKNISLLNPKTWQIQEGKCTFFVIDGMVLVQDGNKTIDPLESKKRVTISLKPDNSTAIQVTYSGAGIEGTRRIDANEFMGGSDVVEEYLTGEDGSKSFKERKQYLRFPAASDLVRYYRINEIGEKEGKPFKIEESGELYEQQYSLARAPDQEGKIHQGKGRPIEIIFDDGVGVRALEIDSEWNQVEKEKHAEEYLQELANKLNTPEKLAVFMHHFLDYVHDSPDPDNPLLDGLEDENFKGQYIQSVLETVLRQKDGRMRGDCDDYALFAREILIRNKNVVFAHSLGVPRHATCLWVQKDPDGGYIAATLGTGGLNKKKGATIKEAYAKVVERFQKGVKGLEKGAEINFDDPNITIIVGRGLREKTTQVSIPKIWLSPESAEGITFFKLTRALDLNDYPSIILHARELMKAHDSFKKWCLDLIFDSALKLKNYDECLDVLTDFDSYLQGTKLGNLILESKFSAIDQVLEHREFQGAIIRIFNRFCIREKDLDPNKIQTFFEKVTKIEPHKNNIKFYDIYVGYLIRHKQYEKARQIEMSTPDQDEKPYLRTVVYSSSAEIAEAYNKIHPNDYIRAFYTCSKAKHPFAKEILEKIESKKTFRHATLEEVELMAEIFEEQNDAVRLKQWRKIYLEKLENEINYENKSEIFYEKAASNQWYLELASLYTVLKEFKKLKKLHDARKRIEKHREYWESVKNDLDGHCDHYFAYLTINSKEKCRINTKPTILSEFVYSIGFPFSQKEKIPIIKVMKEADPEGYHWAQVSPEAKKGSARFFAGKWVRFKNENAKIEKLT